MISASSPRPIRPKLRNSGHFRREPHAARAVNAAGHDRLDQRTDILVLDRALVLLVARRVDAEGHRLILQIAFAALVADRAIERMVDEQEFHHAFAGLLHHRRVGEDFRRLAIRAGTQIAHAHRAGGSRLGRAALHLDEAHAAVAGDRQALVEAEARHFRACLFARLQQRVVIGNLDFPAVDLELRHYLSPLSRNAPAATASHAANATSRTQSRCRRFPVDDRAAPSPPAASAGAPPRPTT